MFHKQNGKNNEYQESKNSKEHVSSNGSTSKKQIEQNIKEEAKQNGKHSQPITPSFNLQSESLEWQKWVGKVMGTENEIKEAIGFIKSVKMEVTKELLQDTINEQQSTKSHDLTTDSKNCLW